MSPIAEQQEVQDTLIGYLHRSRGSVFSERTDEVLDSLQNGVTTAA